MGRTARLYTTASISRLEFVLQVAHGQPSWLYDLEAIGTDLRRAGPAEPETRLQLLIKRIYPHVEPHSAPTCVGPGPMGDPSAHPTGVYPG